MSPLQYADASLVKTLRCPHVHEEYVLKRPFVEGLLSSIWHSIRSYWSSNKNAALQKLDYEATVSGLQQKRKHGNGANKQTEAGQEVAVVNTCPSTSAATTPIMETTEAADNAWYCGMGQSQSHKETSFPMSPAQLRNRIIEARVKSVKSLPKCIWWLRQP